MEPIKGLKLNLTKTFNSMVPDYDEAAPYLESNFK
jgi:hypothetical protein